MGTNFRPGVRLGSVLLLTGSLAACDDGGNSGPTKTVELDTFGPPMLVAVRQGDGDWQALAVAGNRYSIEISEPYVVAVACNDVAGLIDSYQFARTPDDEPLLEAPCTGEAPALPGAASATLLSPGRATIGFNSINLAEPNGAFELPAANGPGELVISSPERVAIRRVQIAGVTELGTIDLAQEGAARIPAGIIVANGDPEALSLGFARLFTEHDTSVSLGSGEVAALTLIPDSVLGAADRQRVTVSQFATDDTTRSVTRSAIRETTDRTFTLPDPLAGASLAETAGTISATWNELPDHDSLDLAIDQFTETEVFFFHNLNISKAFAAEVGTIDLDLDIPGFQAAWKIDVTKEYNRDLSAFKQRSDDETATSRLSQTLNIPSEKPHRTKRIAPKAHLAKRAP
jgi:hypothetical protein